MIRLRRWLAKSWWLARWHYRLRGVMLGRGSRTKISGTLPMLQTCTTAHSGFDAECRPGNGAQGVRLVTACGLILTGVRAAKPHRPICAQIRPARHGECFIALRAPTFYSLMPPKASPDGAIGISNSTYKTPMALWCGR